MESNSLELQMISGKMVQETAFTILCFALLFSRHKFSRLSQILCGIMNEQKYLQNE